LLNVAVFASGRGSNFEALYTAIAKGKVDARIAVVISNNSDAGALKLARSFQIPAIHLSQKQFSSHEAFCDAVLQSLESFRIELIVLAGYMKRIDSAIIQRYRDRIINVHPALLPSFGGEGMYGHFVHEAVIASGAKKSGATVHIVDEEYDHGRVILQESVPVHPDDTPDSLAARVLKVEHSILPRAVQLFAEGKIKIRSTPFHFSS
jgi:phosphoribosylglycinamide formyltransferase 1